MNLLLTLLKLSQQQIDEFGGSIPHEARVMMNPGKNFDGWWNVVSNLFYLILLNRNRKLKTFLL